MIRAIVLASLAVFLLNGCVVRRTEVVRTPGAEPAPARPGAVAAPGEHVVSRGETLYSIAFRNGVDWRDVAAINGLPAPYTIYPGQRLRLSSSGSVAASAPARPAPPVRPETAAVSEVPPAPTPPAAAPPLTSTASTQSPPPAVTAPVATQPPSTAPAQAPVAASSPPPAATTSPPPAAPATPPPTAAVTATAGGLQWRWPTQGEVIQRYSADAARQGIAIAGRSGQVIVAAADGEVVYSGSGLRGYGELVIIKHSPEFLSAYAHNRKRLVNEGERVRAGQPIAEMGRTGTDRDKLHFEIRRGGRPVDPIGFLPRR